LKILPRDVHLTGFPPATAKQHARKALARQSILVVHRGLVHEVRQRLIATFRAVSKEHHVATTHDRNRGVFGAYVDSQVV
jgi:hypothetical protein